MTGAPQTDTRPMYAPTAMAPLMPTLRAPDAVPRMTLTRPSVSTASVSTATVPSTCGAGSVAPLRMPPYIACRNSAARMAPSTSATM